MNLSEWRKKREGEKHVLPSGLEVTLRRCDLMDLAVRGDIPAPLAAAANEMVGGVKVDLADFGKYEAVINVVVGACLIEPAVAEEGDETHVALGELSMQDRMAIYNWASSGAASLRPFRDEKGKPA